MENYLNKRLAVRMTELFWKWPVLLEQYHFLKRHIHKKLEILEYMHGWHDKSVVESQSPPKSYGDGI